MIHTSGSAQAALQRLREVVYKKITDAYGVLGDPDKRKQYDRLRQAGHDLHGGERAEGEDTSVRHAVSCWAQLWEPFSRSRACSTSSSSTASGTIW